jgi:CBS domain-containing protein
MFSKTGRDRNSKNDQGQSLDNERDFRFVIAKRILPLSIGGVLLLALILTSVAIARNDEDTAKWVLAAALPVFGAWVGTILAYYFAKEGFESASRNVTETVERLTGMEKLKSIKVKDKMIVRHNMTVINTTASKQASQISLIGDILKLLDDSKKNRLPILDENDHPLYMIHRSMIDKYLTRKAAKDRLPTKDLDTLKLENLLEDDADLKKNV